MSSRSFNNLETLDKETLIKTQIPLKDQYINLNNKNPKICTLINQLVNEYHDIQTSLNLMELLAPSNRSRAKKVPRPQNKFFLYRRDISKGLCKINHPMPVGESSKAASLLWKSLPKRAREFWNQASIIAKEIHSIVYPDYKFSPNRQNRQKRQKKIYKRSKSSGNSRKYRIIINSSFEKNQTSDLSDISPSISELSMTRTTSEQQVIDTQQYQILNSSSSFSIDENQTSVFHISDTSNEICEESTAQPSQLIDLSEQQQLLNLYFSEGLYQQAAPTQFDIICNAPIPAQHPRFMIMTAEPSFQPPTVYNPSYEDLVLLNQSLGSENVIDPFLLNLPYTLSFNYNYYN
ncbi:hypothetical protein C1645_804344 [Glomus cerebriforme]|uniref:HMG box domain-containing protein n=1 Tax=Glomus cerebriforme TaxID=658196 RepID=A0A397TDA3_9GLOM|nr:hypothetical protein C1645_804344 [Glomus cerebriforme]